jgi:hypothetical protein
MSKGRKEEHQGESKHRVSKVVLAKFGHQRNKSKSEETKQATHLISWP